MVGNSGGNKRSKGSSEGDGTTGSYSSLEDDEAETVDQLAALAARYQIDNVNLGNGNKICKCLGFSFTYINMSQLRLVCKLNSIMCHFPRLLRNIQDFLKHFCQTETLDLIFMSSLPKLP